MPSTKAPLERTAMRLPAKMIAAIDAKVQRGVYRNRTDFVMGALREKLDKEGWA